MTETEDVTTTHKILEGLCQILDKEKDQEKKQDFVRSIVKIISNDYGSTENVDQVCTLLFQVEARRSSSFKAGKDPEIQDIVALKTGASLESKEDHHAADNAPDDLMNKPWMWCLSLDQLNEIGADAEKDYGSIWFKKATMHQIVEKVAVPYCRKTGKGFWASKNPKGLKVTVFVTHSWKENFKEMLQSINSVFKNSLQKPHLWICAFALIQGDYSVIKDQVGERSLRSSPFVQALEKADFFLVVRNSFGDLYSRIWCVCELMFALEFGLVPSRTYITGPDDFADSISGCLEAEASVPEDKDRILSHLTSSMRPEEVDEKIMEFRQLKLPSYSNSRRTLFIMLGTFFVITLVTTLSVIFTRSTPDMTENTILSYISESDFPSTGARKSQKSAIDWLVEQHYINNIKLDGSSDEKDKIALLFILSTFFYDMEGDSWENKENWLGDMNYCDWTAIVCEGKDIIKVDLSNQNLNGTLSMEIAKMTTLIELDVSNNYLSSIPSEVFEGLLIADKIEKQCALKGGLKQLEFMNISKNVIRSVPETIWDLKHLTTLDISNNNIQSVLEVIESTPPTLTNLSLYQDRTNKYLDAVFTNAFKKNKDVTNRDLLDFFIMYYNANNMDIPTIKETIVSFFKTKVVRDEYMKFFNSKIPVMHDNTFADRSPQNFAFNSVLEELMLKSWLYKQSLANTYTWYCLAVFYYSFNGNMWRVKEKWLSPDISYCNWGESVGCVDGDVVSLDLSIVNTQWKDLNGPIPIELFELRKLTKLRFYWNGLTGSIPTELGLLTDLLHLNLRWNQLTGTIPSEIGKLSKLTSLQLSGNSLIGTIPSEIGLMTNLEFFFFNDNKLSGKIPNQLDQLTKLIRLKSNGNNLSGSIPEIILSDNCCIENNTFPNQGRYVMADNKQTCDDKCSSLSLKCNAYCMKTDSFDELEKKISGLEVQTINKGFISKSNLSPYFDLEKRAWFRGSVYPDCDSSFPGRVGLCFCAPDAACKTVQPSMSPSKLPSISRVPTEFCINYPIGWVDIYGKSCGWYSVDDRCASNGNKGENNGFTANEACCVCGGGHGESSEVPSTTISPSFMSTHKTSEAPPTTKSPTDKPNYQPTFTPS